MGTDPDRDLSRTIKSRASYCTAPPALRDRIRAVAPGGMQTLSVQGFNLVVWQDSGMVLGAVSDLNPAELRSFAMALSSKAGP